MRLVTVWRQDWGEYANSAAFLADWPDDTTGSAGSVWALDDTHVVNSPTAARIQLDGTTSMGEEYRRSHTVSGLIPGETYTFVRQVWATDGAPGGINDQFVSVSTDLTADSNGEVEVYVRIVITSGGTVDWTWWFDDLRLVKAEGTPLTFTDFLLNAGHLYADGGVYSLTDGGITFEPSETWEQDSYPGQVEPQAGLDQLTGRSARLSATLIQFTDFVLSTLVPGGTQETVGGDGTSIRRFFPAEPGTTLVQGDMLENVVAEWPKSDGGWARVWMPLAFVVESRIQSEDQGVVKLDIVLEPRKNAAGDPLYYYEREVES